MSTTAPAGTTAQPATTPAEAPAAEPKQIKPIRKGLPGLVNHKDATQPGIGVSFRPKGAAEGAEHLNPAITDGPETKKSPSKATEAAPDKSQGEASLATAEAPAPSPDSAAQAAEPAAAPETFEFAGQKYESREKAEHAIKTMRGMFKSNLERAEKAEKLVHGWNDAYKQLQAENELLKKQGATSADVPTKPGSPAAAGDKPSASLRDRLLEAIDPKTFNEVRERSGDETAQYWAMIKLAELLDERFNSTLGERFKPFEESKAQTAQVERIINTFNGVASMDDPATGEPLYPEFEDPRFREAAVYAWRELNLPEEIAFSHKGVHAAYTIAVDHFRRSGVKLANQSTASPGPEAAAAIDKVAEAAAAGMNSRRDPGVLGGGVPRERPASNGQNVESEIVRRILAAKVRDPKLGFAVTAPR